MSLYVVPSSSAYSQLWRKLGSVDVACSTKVGLGLLHVVMVAVGIMTDKTVALVDISVLCFCGKKTKNSFQLLNRYA
jgi:hypothetical protein